MSHYKYLSNLLLWWTEKNVLVSVYFPRAFNNTGSCVSHISRKKKKGERERESLGKVKLNGPGMLKLDKEEFLARGEVYMAIF